MRLFDPIDTSANLSGGRRPLVLVVDDDAAICAAARRVLERAGYNVREAHSAEEAQQIVESAELCVDVLLTDSHLTTASGLELAEQLNELKPALRVVFMSGDAAGVDSRNLLRKPSTADGLLDEIRAALAL